MAASWTAGLPKLSKAMRGQTPSAWRTVAASARLMATFSAVVCRQYPSRSLAIGERMLQDEVLASLTTCNRPVPLRSELSQGSCD